jgi:hypothetical protein
MDFPSRPLEKVHIILEGEAPRGLETIMDEVGQDP